MPFPSLFFYLLYGFSIPCMALYLYTVIEVCRFFPHIASTTDLLCSIGHTCNATTTTPAFLSLQLRATNTTRNVYRNSLIIPLQTRT